MTDTSTVAIPNHSVLLSSTSICVALSTQLARTQNFQKMPNKLLQNIKAITSHRVIPVSVPTKLPYLLRAPVPLESAGVSSFQISFDFARSCKGFARSSRKIGGDQEECAGASRIRPRTPDLHCRFPATETCHFTTRSERAIVSQTESSRWFCIGTVQMMSEPRR